MSRRARLRCPSWLRTLSRPQVRASRRRRCSSTAPPPRHRVSRACRAGGPPCSRPLPARSAWRGWDVQRAGDSGRGAPAPPRDGRQPCATAWPWCAVSTGTSSVFLWRTRRASPARATTTRRPRMRGCTTAASRCTCVRDAVSPRPPVTAVAVTDSRGRQSPSPAAASQPAGRTRIGTDSSTSRESAAHTTARRWSTTSCRRPPTCGQVASHPVARWATRLVHRLRTGRGGAHARCGAPAPGSRARTDRLGRRRSRGSVSARGAQALRPRRRARGRRPPPGARTPRRRAARPSPTPPSLRSWGVRGAA